MLCNGQNCEKHILIDVVQYPILGTHSQVCRHRAQSKSEPRSILLRLLACECAIVSCGWSSSYLFDPNLSILLIVRMLPIIDHPYPMQPAL
jgi:hypothetical protein